MSANEFIEKTQLEKGKSKVQQSIDCSCIYCRFHKSFFENIEMNSKLLEHLKGRPIAPILVTSRQTNNESALKLMCIIDYKLEVQDLYKELKKVPKLMEKLLQLHSFGSFKYFKYNLPKTHVSDQILLCKYCDLMGPYTTIIEHMVIRHNMHPSAQWCMWCEKADFKNHDSKWCYNEYRGKLRTTSYFSVVTSIQKLLETLADELNVKVLRNKEYKHVLYAQKPQCLNINDIGGEISNEVLEYRPRKMSKKVFDSRALEKEFRFAMKHFYPFDARERFSFKEEFQQLPNMHGDHHGTANQNSKRNKRTESIFHSNKSTSDTQADNSSEPSTSTGQQPTPPEIKNGPDDSNYLNFLATIVNSIVNPDLKEELKKDLKKKALDYALKDINK